MDASKIIAVEIDDKIAAEDVHGAIGHFFDHHFAGANSLKDIGEGLDHGKAPEVPDVSGTSGLIVHCC